MMMLSGLWVGGGDGKTDEKEKKDEILLRYRGRYERVDR